MKVTLTVEAKGEPPLIASLETLHEDKNHAKVLALILAEAIIHNEPEVGCSFPS